MISTPLASSYLRPSFSAWDQNGIRIGYRPLDGLPPLPDLDPEPVVDEQAGSRHACRLLRNGQVWCEGDHELGQRPKSRDCAGAAPTPDPGPCGTDPARIAAVTGATQISVADDLSCAVTVEHKVMCWGRIYWPNGWLLLPGATYASMVPMEGFGQAVQVQVSQSHICVLDMTGTVRCFGRNSSGQLGDGSTRTTVNPVRVSGIDDAIEIAVGGNFTCAVRQDRSVWCWGSNGYGTLGIGSQDVKRSLVPVQALPPGSVSERRETE